MSESAILIVKCRVKSKAPPRLPVSQAATCKFSVFVKLFLLYIKNWKVMYVSTIF
jgi:hypothetical protein